VTDRSRFRDRLFRHRGLVPVVPIVLALWFARPTPAGFALGAGLMLLGEAIRFWGATHLGRRTRSSRPISTGIVTTGPYAHTRHPLYWGNLLLVTGFAVASGAGRPWFPALAAVGFIALYATHALAEEAVLRGAFPSVWRDYAARVPAWRWRLTPVRVTGAGECDRLGAPGALRVEALTLNAEFWLLAVLGFRLGTGV